MLIQIVYYIGCKCFPVLKNSKLRSMQFVPSMCVMWFILHHMCCWHFCHGLILLLGSVWCALFTICTTDASLVLFYPQDVCDVVCSLLYVLLMLLWACSAFSGCVMWSVLHMHCWCSHGLVLLSESVWYSLSLTIFHADATVGFFYPQKVCDVVCSAPYPLLMLPWPCFSPRKCVMWSVICHMHCWCLCGLVLPSECAWCGLFCTICAADTFLSWPYSALRKCVMWSVLYHCCWCSCDFVLYSACMRCYLFSTIWAIDVPMGLFGLQWVCDVSVLYMYCWCFHCLCPQIVCDVIYSCFWCSCDLVLPSECAWCYLFSTIWAADTPVALFFSQDVCNVVFSPPYALLMFLWPCSAFSMYVNVVYSAPHVLMMLQWPCYILRKCVMQSFLHHMCYWYSCGLVLPLVGVWCSLFFTICASDASLVLLYPQIVCNVLVLYHIQCWCFHGLVMSSESVWWSVLY